MDEVPDSYSAALFTRILGWTPEELEWRACLVRVWEEAAEVVVKSTYLVIVSE